MIQDRDSRIAEVASIITQRIARINEDYRRGPSLHFYRRVRELRTRYPSAEAFIECHECVEILYATLVSWDMNSRGAKMKDYADFWQNLRDCLPLFRAVEASAPLFTWANRRGTIRALAALYKRLNLMQTGGRLVSNSKCCHFLFPSLCMPMDRKNTLQKIYGNTTESPNKFIELLEFCYDVLAGIDNPQQYLDDQWNASTPKLVDNAILMM